MPGLIRAIQDDVEFVRGHTLQPRWYKVFKVLLVFGVVAGFGAVFGLRRAAVFLGVFLLLSLCVHMLYRRMTHQWTRSWLDFEVVEQDGLATPRRIGAPYYGMIAFNALLAIVVSLMLP